MPETLKRKLEIAIAIVGLPIALVGLLFAWDQYRNSRKQAVELVSIELAARGAVEAASTRVIGKFPTSIPVIKEAIGGTCEHLIIMADVAGYGTYSAHNASLKYLDAIEDLASNTAEEMRRDSACNGIQMTHSSSEAVHIRMILYAPNVLRQSTPNQFKRETYAETMGKPSYAQFFHDHGFQRASNYEEFIDDLIKSQLQYVIDLASHGVEIRFSDHRYQIYFWMHDGAEVAFSLDYQGDYKGDVEQEIAFRSRDQNLTTALQQIFELEWKKATPVDVASLRAMLR
jgi:hypothetical protein